MGVYASSLPERLRDGREVKISPEAKRVRKNAAKKARLQAQRQALEENTKIRPYYPKPSKNDIPEWRNKEPKYKNG